MNVQNMNEDIPPKKLEYKCDEGQYITKVLQFGFLYKLDYQLENWSSAETICGIIHGEEPEDFRRSLSDDHTDELLLAMTNASLVHTPTLNNVDEKCNYRHMFIDSDK